MIETERLLLRPPELIDLDRWADMMADEAAQRLGSVNHGPGQLPAPYNNASVEIWGQTREQWRQSQC
jgi:RimJ/RimL family protein N-acetyltransferase